MITKETNVAMNLKLPKNLKEEFTNMAYRLGTNPTNLLKMLIVDTINKKQVNFTINPILDFEIEPFSDEEISDLMSDKEMQKNMKKMEKLLSKRKQIGK